MNTQTVYNGGILLSNKNNKVLTQTKLGGYIAIYVDFRAKKLIFSLLCYHFHNDKEIISSEDIKVINIYAPNKRSSK